MPFNYLRGHKTDDVLGRTGTTLDWPNSISNFDPSAWNDYVHRPPTGTKWQNLLMGQYSIVACNAVKPFAMYFEYSCNLILISKTLFDAFDNWHDTFDEMEAGSVSFGKRVKEYQFCSLAIKNVFSEQPFSAHNLFSRFDSSALHIHGTRVQRGEETIKQCPKALEENLSFKSAEELQKARLSLTVLVPTHIEIHSSYAPKLISTGAGLFVREDVAEKISSSQTPGISFPYKPTTVCNIPNP